MWQIREGFAAFMFLTGLTEFTGLVGVSRPRMEQIGEGLM